MDLSKVTWMKQQCKKVMSYDTSFTDCGTYCKKTLCLQSGSLQLKNVLKVDEGDYEFTLTDTTKKSFLLKVSEPAQIPAIQIRCLPDGGGELSCEGDGTSSGSFRWMLNGHPVGSNKTCSEACTKDNGKRIILAKGVIGELVCQIQHGNSSTGSSPVKVKCDEGDLLQQPLFPYVLAACGGGAILLAALVSLITWGCLRSKQNFIPVPSAEEKEEGMTMSVISSEETKSPPNGDHHEAPAAPDANPSNLENRETCQGLEAEHQMEAKSEEALDPEMVVDDDNQEFLCDNFPDPIDP
uniref:Ig-like domain-containing protein n=1 Tax=Pelusios castaneus TaxID=367368 RepID=A0A8C8RC53_9SAUR